MDPVFMYNVVLSATFYGIRNMKFTATVFSINYCTFKVWITNKDFILWWIIIFESYTGIALEKLFPESTEINNGNQMINMTQR